jgi:hypothetical protein
MIISVFGTEDEFKRWTKMFLLRSPELVAKVTEIESTSKIGVNFVFKDLEPK